MRAFKLVRSTSLENVVEFKALYKCANIPATHCATWRYGLLENRLKTGLFLLVKLRNLECRLFVRFCE